MGMMYNYPAVPVSSPLEHMSHDAPAGILTLEIDDGSINEHHKIGTPSTYGAIGPLTEYAAGIARHIGRSTDAYGRRGAPYY